MFFSSIVRSWESGSSSSTSLEESNQMVNRADDSMLGYMKMSGHSLTNLGHVSLLSPDANAARLSRLIRLELSKLSFSGGHMTGNVYVDDHLLCGFQVSNGQSSLSSHAIFAGDLEAGLIYKYDKTECLYTPEDILFVVDGSGSEDIANFQKELQNITGQFEIGLSADCQWKLYSVARQIITASKNLTKVGRVGAGGRLVSINTSQNVLSTYRGT